MTAANARAITGAITGVRRRVAVAGISLAAIGVAVFGVLAPPEDCPKVTADDLRASATEAVQWFGRNQRPNGMWLYEYDRDTAAATSDYNVVRHSGVLMSLYQAATVGIPGARESADRGLAWSMDQIEERDDWAAITYQSETSVGAVALLAAGLAERRLDTGDPRYDDLLRRLGRFLAAQTEDTGAVLAYYDPVRRAPLAGKYSKYYTGEAYWALGRLHELFPAEGWGEVADRVGAYMATRRDDAEDYWPPLPDHWAAYGLAQTAEFDDRPSPEPLTTGELDYARQQAGLFGVQVRWVSQQEGPWGKVVRGTYELRGGGYGVVGEALTGLWLVSHADDRLFDLRTPIADRATCITGLALRTQADERAAAAFEEPGRVQGAWFRDGVTRMDDQQHALSAILRTIPIVEASQVDAAEDDRQAPAVWLWLLALIAAVNPFRAAFAVPRADRRTPDVVRLAALGGLLATAAVLLAAFLGDLFLDAIDVSAPAMRIGAGVVAAVAGLVALVRRAPSPEPSLPGWRAALVPIAVPVVASPVVLVLAVSAFADHGALLVGGALVVTVAVLLALVGAGPGDAVRVRIQRWAARLTGAVLTVAAALLVIDGIFAV